DCEVLLAHAGDDNIHDTKRLQLKAGERMASITSQPNGRRTIQFVCGDGKRRTIRLGKTPMRIAETIKGRGEHLVAAAFGSGAIDPDTARWLTTIDKRLADKLSKVGLAAKRESKPAATLRQFCEGYVEGRADLKSATKVVRGVIIRDLVAYFG